MHQNDLDGTTNAHFANEYFGEAISFINIGEEYTREDLIKMIHEQPTIIYKAPNATQIIADFQKLNDEEKKNVIREIVGEMKQNELEKLFSE